MSEIPRITRHWPAGTPADPPAAVLTLAHHERHLRRKLLHFDDGRMAMLDLKEPVLLADGDLLPADNGDIFLIRAAPEKLYAIRGRNALHLTELAWHLGNRHLPAEIREDAILIQRDPVMLDMLTGLGATVTAVEAPFQPLRGAYHHHAHG